MEEIEETKQCIRCNKIKPLYRFNKGKINRYRICIQCRYGYEDDIINKPEEKRCTKCKKVKIETDFYFNDKTRRIRMSICKECSMIKRSKIGHNHNITKTKHKKLKSYKLTIAQYNNILIKQNHKCRICCKQTELVIDHDHNTGKVRGLLCQLCNSGIGFFKDKQENLFKAIEYLSENE